METRIFALVILCFLLLSFHGNESVLLKNRVAIDPTRVTQISRSPRAFVYKGFLTPKECEHLINLAKDNMTRSLVVDDDTGGSVETEIRTSSGKFLDKYQDEIVRKIEDQIAAWTLLPIENGESLQILHYEYGQKYEPHFDNFESEEIGGQRMATVLMYLSNVDIGGETVFPDFVGDYVQPKGDNWSECAKKGYAVKPRKGDALLFFSLHLNGTSDVTSLHESCPVIKGDKWSATKWIHERSFDRPTRRVDECIDENKYCTIWAAEGECEKNPKYMVGSKDFAGYCRKSCRACSS